MSVIRVESSHDVAAPQQQVYRVIADYKKEERQRWLPPNVGDYALEKGGQGKGTVYSYRLKVGNRERAYRMTVAEPRPGSQLTESDTGSSLVTTWTVVAQGSGSRVSIRTEWQGHGGVGGFFERLFAPAALKRVYDDELGRLASYVTSG